jgi:hypothetical protein
MKLSIALIIWLASSTGASATRLRRLESEMMSMLMSDSMTSGYPACSVCGSDKIIHDANAELPDNVISILPSGFHPVDGSKSTCSILDSAGRMGMISPEICGLIAPNIQDVCGCAYIQVECPCPEPVTTTAAPMSMSMSTDAATTTPAARGAQPKEGPGGRRRLESDRKGGETVVTTTVAPTTTEVAATTTPAVCYCDITSVSATEAATTDESSAGSMSMLMSMSMSMPAMSTPVSLFGKASKTSTKSAKSKTPKDPMAKVAKSTVDAKAEKVASAKSKSTKSKASSVKSKAGAVSAASVSLSYSRMFQS